MPRALGLAEFKILRALQIQNGQYGLQLADFIRKLAERPMSGSVLYTTLHRLIDRRYVKCEQEKNQKRMGRPRIHYKLTSRGRVACDRFIGELRAFLDAKP